MEDLNHQDADARLQSFSETRWAVLDTMYARRSHRKYKPTVLDDEFCREFADLTGRACAARARRLAAF